MEEQEKNRDRNAENRDIPRKNDRQRQNRNHRKKSGKPHPEAAKEKNNAENQADNSGKTGKKDTSPNSNRPEKQHKNSGKRQSGQSSGKDRNSDRKKQNRNGGNVHTRRGLEDLYGNPTENDVMTAEEWRAKIVLKAADGSIPSSNLSTATQSEVQEPPEEPMEELPTDLLIPGSENPATAAADEDSVEVIGVRFRSAGKVYYFDPKGLKIRLGDPVIVETARGPEYGDTVFGNRNISKQSTVSPLRPVLRIATKEDTEHNIENQEKEHEAFSVCQQKIAAHKLDMKLIDVQYAFDNSKLLFYFTSDGRVDFRDLVKDLASVFRTRIELRQIGIRDEAKMLGGLGACGRPLCCASFLSDFVQVSIKMAKEQGLSLNSAKISGVCGRLMCCLRYESAVYAEEIRMTPPHDSTVQTADGIGTVIGSNPLAGTVKVLLKNAPDTPPKFYSRDEVTVLGHEKTDSTEKKD